jgi:hypothetical protein
MQSMLISMSLVCTQHNNLYVRLRQSFAFCAIFSVIVFVPLHSSPGGLKYGRVSGSMAVTDFQSESLIRLPLWIGLSHIQQEQMLGTFSLLG